MEFSFAHSPTIPRWLTWLKWSSFVLAMASLALVMVWKQRVPPKDSSDMVQFEEAHAPKIVTLWAAQGTLGHIVFKPYVDGLVHSQHSDRVLNERLGTKNLCFYTLLLVNFQSPAFYFDDRTAPVTMGFVGGLTLQNYSLVEHLQKHPAAEVNQPFFTGFTRGVNLAAKQARSFLLAFPGPVQYKKVNYLSLTLGNQTISLQKRERLKEDLETYFSAPQMAFFTDEETKAASHD